MHPTTAARRKELGAYYTDVDVVGFLARWGVRGRPVRVLDPSCGDGRILTAAAASGAAEVVGCDVDPYAVAATRDALAGFDGGRELMESDFFAVAPEAIEPVDVVLGNPPFIRYQRFQGASRRRALQSALQIGVRLTRLTSSWAPFLLHATRVLRPGGHLGMVVPAEITRTQYGLLTLHALTRRFSDVALLVFDDNLFSDAQTETCLLLATGLGGRSDAVRVNSLPGTSALSALAEGGWGLADGTRVPVEDGARPCFAQAFLTMEEQAAWQEAAGHRMVRTLGSLGSITNGYVSGDNAFYHRTRADALAAGYPAAWLRPAARGSRSLVGLRLTAADLEAHESASRAHHLLVPDGDDGLFGGPPDALAELVREGERLGVDARYKCRTRTPWWRVPGLVRADVLLTYMAGERPRAAVNATRAVYTNTLHGLRLPDGTAAEPVAFAFYSTLTLLSLELEGRSYGGGILKLEPTEMLRVRIPWPEDEPSGDAIARADWLLRAGRYEEVVTVVDDLLLIHHLGLTPRLVETLRRGRQRLVRRRIQRNRRPRRAATT